MRILADILTKHPMSRDQELVTAKAKKRGEVPSKLPASPHRVFVCLRLIGIAVRHESFPETYGGVWLSQILLGLKCKKPTFFNVSFALFVIRGMRLRRHPG